MTSPCYIQSLQGKVQTESYSDVIPDKIKETRHGLVALFWMTKQLSTMQPGKEIKLGDVLTDRFDNYVIICTVNNKIYLHPKSKYIPTLSVEVIIYPHSVCRDHNIHPTL